MFLPDNIKSLKGLTNSELRLVIFISYMNYYTENGNIPLKPTFQELMDETFRYIRPDTNKESEGIKGLKFLINFFRNLKS